MHILHGYKSDRRAHKLIKCGYAERKKQKARLDEVQGAGFDVVCSLVLSLAASLRSFPSASAYIVSDLQVASLQHRSASVALLRSWLRSRSSQGGLFGLTLAPLEGGVVLHVL